MNILEQLVGSDSIWVSERAQNAIQIQQAVQSGQMNKSEGTELLNDLINGDSLDKVADDFIIRTQLVNAINDIIMVIEGLSCI
jgi:polyhydroxyalkanoate synthesis regulator phasin